MTDPTDHVRGAAMLDELELLNGRWSCRIETHESTQFGGVVRELFLLHNGEPVLNCRVGADYGPRHAAVHAIATALEQLPELIKQARLARDLTAILCTEEGQDVLERAKALTKAQERLRWFEAAHTLCANDGLAFIGARYNGGTTMFFAAQNTNYEPILCILCSDTFGYGCADAESAEYIDAPALLEIAKTEGWYGLVKWIQARRQERGEQAEPIEPVKKIILEFSEVRAERDSLRAALVEKDSEIAKLRAAVEFARLHGKAERCSDDGDGSGHCIKCGKEIR